MKSLRQKCKDGLKYFHYHPAHLRLRMWRKFVRTVLKPHQEELMSLLDEEEKREVTGHLEEFGHGFLTGVGE